jgi:CTP synthase (UTP-ammonia lyase)
MDEAVAVAPGSRAAALYAAETVVEPYRCGYALNPDYRAALERAGLRATGVDATGEVRIVELPHHPFFLATLFVPQLRSRPDHAHPLLRGFAAAIGARPRGMMRP